jgi:hypothetical protein
LRLFLQRAVEFSASIFVLFNVDVLTGKQQDIVRSFLADKSNMSSGINLHCIQNNCNVLGAYPWVQSSSWDLKDLFASQHATRESSWVSSMLQDQGVFDEILIFWSHGPGTGKTKAIRDRIAGMEESMPQIEVATINVHEGTSMESIHETLEGSFSVDSTTRCVYFNLSFMASKATLVDTLNTFFLSFVLTGAVNDSNRGLSFFARHCRWHIFIELQSWHSLGVDNAEPIAWMQTNIPILATSGQFVSPPEEFVVDDKARRVCTYLRAYEDGTIDRKFASVPENKNVIFVIDESGSMMGNKFNTATQCMHKIVESHIQTGDVSKTTIHGVQMPS